MDKRLNKFPPSIFNQKLIMNSNPLTSQHQAITIANTNLYPLTSASMSPALITPGLSATLKSSLLFIDSGVEDVETIVGAASPLTEVHLLQSGQDAITQITATLLGRSGIESLQIVSHGRSGGLKLGESWWDLASLPNYVGQLKSWGEALSQDADILLYGCDVASEPAGQAFVHLLAQATGADVAASDDLTGYGGDWELEVRTGVIDTIGFDLDQINAYQNNLGAVNLDTLVNRQSSVPRQLTVVNNTILVVSNVGLEIINATGYPQILKSVSTGDILPNLTVAGNNAFFVSTNNNRQGLWKTDGTVAGTVLVKNIAPTGQPLSGSDPSIMANVNGTLFFTADDGTNGLELWKSDGTAAGTVLVKDINAGTAGSTPQQLVAVDNTLFFTATTPESGRELWKSDGTAAGTVLVKEFVSGAGSIDITLGTGANGSLFFKGFSQQQGAELWKSDGTEAGTVLVKDIRTGGGTSQPKDFITIGNTVFFAASTSANGEEVWKTDGTEAGTVLVKDIYPGTNASLSTGIEKFVNVNGTLFFRSKDGIHGDELWKSDGTAAGTVMVKDIAVGAAGSDLKNLSSVNGQLYFAANDGVAGEELWRSDGTTAGTVRVAELISGDFGGSPSRIVGNGDVVAFAGYGSNLINALWRYSDSNEIVRFYPSDPNILLLENGAIAPYYRLSRIGSNFAAPLEVQLEIDPSSTASLSDYNLSVTNGSMSINGSIITVTIPANTSDAVINITLIDDTLSEGSETLKLNLLKNPSQYATYTQSSVTATIQTNDNNPPSLNNVALNLSAINANAPAPVGAVGTSITQLVSLTSGTIGPRNVFDANANALTGIALAATDTTNGQWFYTLNNGTTWQPVGTVSNTSALLLPGNESTRLYFQPNSGYLGTIANAITLRAWDQVDGQAGSKVDLSKAQPLSNPSFSWSIASDTASITVNQAITNSPPSGNVTIAGNVRVNQILTASNTIVDPDVVGAITYQWQESNNGTDWTNLATGNTFSITSNQLGKQLRTVANYTDGLGQAESITSAVTTAVLQALPVNQAPSALTLGNAVNTIAANTNTTNRLKVADLTIVDDGLGTNNITLTGTDAANFEIDANSLYLKAGTALNATAKPNYSVSINVDDTTVGATPDLTQVFNLTVNPVGGNTSNRWQQLGLDIDGEFARDRSGASVSLSADGQTVAIGARFNDGTGRDSGHVRIYRFSNSAWTQIGSDIDGEALGDELGFSVSLSADGQTVAIGAQFNDGTGRDSGHVRIYRFSNNTWTQVGSDIDGEARDDYSGSAVSLSADGNTVAISARGNDGNGTSSGHMRIYRLNNNLWAKVGNDIDGEATGDESGWSVSLSTDGSTVAIGAPYNDGNGNNSGHARVYRLINDAWTQLGGDIDGEAFGDEAGQSVSLSADGNTIAVGAPNNDGTDVNSGHVRVYRFVNNAWTKRGNDIDGEAVNDTSGRSVSLSADGNTVAIGAPYNGGTDGNSGHTRVYRFNNNAWIKVGNDIDGEALGNLSGGAISLSADGSIVAIGAISNGDSGHVRVYRFASSNALPTGTVTISGTATQGQLLTATNTLADVDGLGEIFYQWMANGENIIGATSPTYRLTQAEVGKAITVKASYIDGQNNPESVLSAAVGNVANINDAPIGTVIISGTTTQGQALTATNAFFDTDGLGTISYQWQANGIDIVGATNATYTLTSAEVGKTIIAKANYIDGQGTAESVTSAATTTVSQMGNNNQQSEIIARNKATGEITILFTDPVTQQPTQRPLTFGANLGALAGQVASVGANWTVSDTADFNGDGIADMLLHNKMGDEVAIWLVGANGTISQATALQQNGQTLRTQNTNWRVVGFADLDRDNILDLVWHNRESDEVGIWFMNADGINVREYDYLREANGQVLKTNNTRWQAEGIGDFDGDGDMDLLFRLPELNQTAIVRLNGKTVFDTQSIAPNSDVNLIVEQIADSNNNGTADIYWRNPATNQVIIQPIALVSNAWQSGQFNLIANVTSAFQAILNAQGQTISLDLTNWELLGTDDFGRLGGNGMD
jgi:ELWxxDGT repeat protein